MIGELSSDQIDVVLRSQVIGRIGCRSDHRLYVVPINYAYDGTFLYMHAREGLKIEMMRKYPEVCFEVDVIESMTSWRSVIAWGVYEELKTEAAQQKALRSMNDTFLPRTQGETLKARQGNFSAPEVIEKNLKAVVFRIRIKEKTGRFEKT